MEAVSMEPISAHGSLKARLLVHSPTEDELSHLPCSLQHISVEQGFLHKDIIPQYFLLFSPSSFMASRPLRYGSFVQESFNDLRVVVLASV